MRPLILALLLATTTLARAQAPIERRPPPPAPLTPPAPSAQWTIFAAAAPSYTPTEIWVNLPSGSARCVLDDVTPDALFCHRDLGLVGHLHLFPNTELSFAGPTITRVDRTDRAASAFLGIAAGFTFGAALAATHSSGTQAQHVLISGAILGTIGGCLGHAIPLIHHTLYRAPRH